MGPLVMTPFSRDRIKTINMCVCVACHSFGYTLLRNTVALYQ